MSLRLLHTSDWHLGRHFHNHSLLEDQRLLLDQLAEVLLARKVDALLIAGDVYDRSVPPADAVTVLNNFLNKVAATCAIPVIMIPGNHDSAERLGFAAQHLKASGLHIISDFDSMLTPVTLNKDGTHVEIWAMPYNDPEQVRSHFRAQDEQIDTKVPAGSYDAANRYLLNLIDTQPHSGSPRILLSHCFLAGAEACESERPLSIGGSDQVSIEPLLNYDYVALGHLHSPQSRVRETIRYSGSLMKYSFSEADQHKSVTLLEIEGDDIKVNEHSLTPRRDMRILEGSLESLLAAGASDPNADDYLLIRLTDQQALLNPMERLREVYPNVLHLEKTGFYQQNSELTQNRERLQRGPRELFGDFFAQITGSPLQPEQQQALDDTLNELKQGEH